MDVREFILVVEDSPTQARQIEETLGRAGYASKLAYSGREALEVLEKEKPLLVLADIVMPEMDGFELCKSMKARDSLKSIPVILLTQLSDPREVVRGMECGADDFVVKPYNEQALLARIEGMLSIGQPARAGTKDVTIIVAEDSPTQAEQLKFLLERRGYSVLLASNGQECLDLASKKTPTLIISDVVMPVMDGYELAYRMKQIEPLSRVPVILITSLMDRKDIVQRASVVADAFFTKPFEERYLISKIETLLSSANREGDDSSSIEVSFAGERYTIKSGKKQILTFLLSTYENAVQQNRELTATQKELQLLNENLEERVLKRTRQLQESEANYRRLLETSADAIVVAGRDNTVFFMNRAAEELFGAKYEDMEGKQFFILLSGLGTKDVEVLKDGGRAYAEARTVATTWGEEPALLAAFRETTKRKRMEEELRESEQNFRALSANDGIAIVALEGDCRVIYFNRRLAEMIGYAPGELLKMSFGEITELAGCHGLKDALDSGQYCHNEVPFKTSAGALVPVEMAASKTLWHGQKAAILLVRDIAERKKREEELLKASKLESLGTLAGGIAHDFNNLLTAIIGNLSVARLLSQKDEKVAKPLIDADNAAHRAKDLTKQLLTFSRGGLPVKMAVDLSGIIRESASFSVRGSNIKCNIDMPGSLPAVEADEGQISQVIHNLLINADQAMPGGGIITVSTAVVEGQDRGRQGRFLRIQVSDTGKGIKEEHLGKVFDPYFTTKKEGSGLGLATVYSIIRNHDGFVELESHRGKGTTFSIYLPVTGKPLPEKGGRVEEELERGHGRILVMDDEHMVREAAGTILEELGYEVEFAENGHEAIARYGDEMRAGRPFDAVIMDLTIPAGMGGKEAVRRVLEIDADARVIVSSGYSNDDIMSNFKSFGFSAVIAKPYRITDLSRTVKSVMDGRKKV
ncbi:MAG: response regulator [Deltaproteobacteria bacterium]|nr:response regulator [Deltaproteobacteria bacterium]